MSGSEDEEIFFVSQWSMLLQRGHGDTVPAQTVAAYLATSKLDNGYLARIWDLANPAQRDVFDMPMFFNACRLVAQAQNGRDLIPSARDSALPLPQFAQNSPSGSPALKSYSPQSVSPAVGFSPQSLANAFSVPAVAMASPQPSQLQQNTSPVNSRPVSFNQANAVVVPVSKTPIPGYLPIPHEEKMKYNEIFQSQRPVQGLITEDQAKAVFLKSQQPSHIIEKICYLCDLNRDGKLDLEEFCIGMRITYDVMTGALKSVPGELPLELLPKGRLIHPIPTASQHAFASLAPQFSSQQSPSLMPGQLGAGRMGPSPAQSPRPSPQPSPHPSPPQQFKQAPQPQPASQASPRVPAEDPEEIAALERSIEAEVQKAKAAAQKADQGKQSLAKINQQIDQYSTLAANKQQLRELTQADISSNNRLAEVKKQEVAGEAEATAQLTALLDQGQQLASRLSQSLQTHQQRLADLGGSS